MKLWYINIWLNPATGYDQDYRYKFLLHTRFISNYLSRMIRKYKIETDGTFDMISVHPTPGTLDECTIIPDKAVAVSISFDKERYEKIKGTADYEYYLELFETGFKKASEFKTIPLDTLLDLMDDFRKNGYKNEWLHKKKRFKERDIEVVLDCRFTTFDFRLIATINRLSTGEKLCSGVVIHTEPDEINFNKMFKDILIDGRNIVITDASDGPRILINLNDALHRRFNFLLIGDRQLRQILSL